MTGLVTTRPHWDSFHVFLADPVRSEHWLTEVLLPLLGEWTGQRTIDSWFFIRYWEGGPHIRLRLRALLPTRREAVASAIGARMSEFLSNKGLDREDYYARHSFDGAPINQDLLPWFDEGSVAEITYEPEYQRYGGEAAMTVSEELFAVSSQLAARIIAGTIGELPARASRAALVMAVMINAAGYTGDAAARFAAGQFAMWSHYSSATRAQAERALPASGHADQAAAVSSRIFAQAAATAAPSAPLAPLSRAVENWRDRLNALGGAGQLILPHSGNPVTDQADIEAAIGQILSSQLHMNCNRLGLNPVQEMALAGQLAGSWKNSQTALEIT